VIWAGNVALRVRSYLLFRADDSLRGTFGTLLSTTTSTFDILSTVASAALDTQRLGYLSRSYMVSLFLPSPPTFIYFCPLTTVLSYLQIL
jgi:hypothetical protein